MTFHVQCKLRKRLAIPYCVENGEVLSLTTDDPPHYAYQTSWLPEKFAVVGRYVRLRTEDDDNPWDDGWEVIMAGPKLDSKTVQERGSEYRKHRSVTDV